MDQRHKSKSPQFKIRLFRSEGGQRAKETYLRQKETEIKIKIHV